MYIVWRQRPITSNRRTELFVEYDSRSVADASGNIKSGRHKVPEMSIDYPAWKPLWCEHRGPNRIAWTPMLMHAERIDGKPRTKLLRRFATIRSCCIKVQLIRAAWWHEIEQWDREVERSFGWHGEQGYFHARDRQEILAKLREVVPLPTATGVKAFTDYRLAKEEERRRLLEPIERQAAEDRRKQIEEQERRRQERLDEERRRTEKLKEQTRQLEQLVEKLRRQRERHEEEQRRQQEQSRRAKEQAEEARRAQEQRSSHHASGSNRAAGPKPTFWAVLGLSPTTNVDEIQRHYHKLSKQHHPDRFGDEETQKDVVAAYEQACKFAKAHSPSR